MFLFNTLALFVFDDLAIAALVATMVTTAAGAAMQAQATIKANKAAEQTAKNAKNAAAIAEQNRKAKEAEEIAQTARAFDKARKAQEASASTRNALGVSSEGLSIALLGEGLAAQRNSQLNALQDATSEQARLGDITDRARNAMGSPLQSGLIGGFEGLQTGLQLGGSIVDSPLLKKGK